MNLYQGQFRRLVVFDGLVRQGKYPNATQFSDAEGISRRTVVRDIALLKERGAPLEYDAEHNGYKYTNKSWQLPAMDLSEGELLQLLVAERMAEQYKGTPIAKDLENLFAKLSAALPDKVTVSPEYAGDSVSFHSAPSRDIGEKVWITCLKALQRLKVLHIEYSPAGTNEVKTRDVEPVHVACIADEWYLIAHCLERDEIRHFAMGRIKSASLQKTDFEPKEFDPKKYFANRFGRFVGQDGKVYDVKLSFDAEAAMWVQERKWHPKQLLTLHSNGKVTLEFPAPALFEVKRWVLSWGGAVKVIAPKELRDDVLMAAAKKYK
jgi:predicted DNA-binding transcriptional regulator YafY